MMGLSELHYYDLYAPLVGSVNSKYTPEEAQRHILDAMKPLGAEYGTVSAGLQRAVDRSLSERRASVPARIRMAAPTTSIRTC